MIRFHSLLAVGMLAGASLYTTGAQAQDATCPVRIGGVLSLTGSMGAVGKNIANSAQLAIDHINEGGGIKGCKVEFLLRDDQGQPNVGVDAAKFLVEVDRVSAITGAISSGVTIPILTSVTAPAGIPQIGCCSSAPVLTDLAKQGKTGGYFFRTFPSVKNLAYPPASVAIEKGLKRVAVIYINTDYGTSLVKDFSAAMKTLGGEVVSSVAFNENQASYRAEVSTALASKPDAVFLVAFPQDGATLAREWISLGGTRKLILNNALRSADFVKAVGAQYLTESFGTDNASAGGPELDTFRGLYEAAYKVSAEGPGIYNEYDAVMVLGLAMNIAPDLSGAAIRDSIRKIHTSGGTAIGTGPEAFAEALKTIKEGKPIRYNGATGPLEFDAYGDVTGPALTWSIGEDGALKIDSKLSMQDMQALFKKIDG
ncbi:ABC transporter substrate-binding protein [Rhizobium sp. RU36D]|uniref:ABC transporter substrate-binding protein n=1 Tax=Rhizobium sp. RU36D TaxID=1907415 RepID=UPI0009D8B4DA|nr:ABC transporter substrate-binding protein [Rhizobium sp. RU36D]SMC71624.1 branched-chain amino acid transport system substrate-binding protein [Rhizobium sp. RU36D]